MQAGVIALGPVHRVGIEPLGMAGIHLPAGEQAIDVRLQGAD
ncbi:MAG: hypothetical protein ACRD15_21525 [Vicinamibacterales bacterium]